MKYLALIRGFKYLQVSCQGALEKQNGSLGQCTGKKSLANLNFHWKTWLEKSRLHYSSICNHIQPLSLQVSSTTALHCMDIIIRWWIYHVLLTDDQMFCKLYNNLADFKFRTKKLGNSCCNISSHRCHLIIINMRNLFFLLSPSHQSCNSFSHHTRKSFEKQMKFRLKLSQLVYNKKFLSLRDLRISV